MALLSHIYQDGKLRLTLSMAVLIAANLVPLYGALFEGWSVLDLLLVYWFENAVIGVLTVVMIVTAAITRHPNGFSPLNLIRIVPFAIGAWLVSGHFLNHTAATNHHASPFGFMLGFPLIFISLPRVAFFCVHYGIFTMGHGILIYAIFGNGPFANGVIKPEYWPYLYEPFLPHHPLFFPAAAILIGRVASFVTDFIIRGEYKTANPDRLMFKPYGRIFILHVVILVGGFLAMEAGSNIAALALLVVIKTVIDMELHLREHNPALKPAKTGEQTPNI